MDTTQHVPRWALDRCRAECDGLLADLGQARYERDEWRERAETWQKRASQAREQVQTLRAALDTIADHAAFDIANNDSHRKIYLVAREALAATKGGE